MSLIFVKTQEFSASVSPSSLTDRIINIQEDHEIDQEQREIVEPRFLGEIDVHDLFALARRFFEGIQLFLQFFSVLVRGIGEKKSDGVSEGTLGGEELLGKTEEKIGRAFGQGGDRLDNLVLRRAKIQRRKEQTTEGR